MHIKRVLAGATLMLASASALGQQSDGGSIGNEITDAWVDGKVEMAYTLNEHLNPFEIETEVLAGVVMLGGTVDSDIESDLAEEIARGIDGVVDVKNEIEVGTRETNSAAASSGSERRNFPTWFDDATTTAAVKGNLFRNSNTKALQIDVDTNEDVVTLSGSVESGEQKDLAGEIARNTGDVKGVRNLLVVSNH